MSQHWTKDLRAASREETVTYASHESVIKARAFHFNGFIDAMDKPCQSFWGGKRYVVPQRGEESKKRFKYWMSNLFDPTPFQLSGLVSFVDIKENGSSMVESRKVMGVFDVIPLGADIWGTLGGTDENSSSVNWDNALIYFVPSATLSIVLGKKRLPIAFSMIKNIALAEKSELTDEDAVRQIDL